MRSRPEYVGAGSDSLEKILVFALFGGLAAGCIFLFFVDPVESGFFPPCWFNRITGLYCPGCGGLRSAHALVHGRLMDALSFNALFVLVIVPLTIYLAFIRIYAAVRGREVGISLSTRMAWGIVALVIVFFVLRNIPCFPFNLLAP